MLLSAKGAPIIEVHPFRGIKSGTEKLHNPTKSRVLEPFQCTFPCFEIHKKACNLNGSRALEAIVFLPEGFYASRLMSSFLF